MAEKKWFPLHPCLHPSPQQHCSSSGTSQAEKFEKEKNIAEILKEILKQVLQEILPKFERRIKIVARKVATRMLVKYSRGCVASIRNLGPNSKCVIFTIQDGYRMSEYGISEI